MAVSYLVPKVSKYAPKSLRTRSQSAAIEHGEAAYSEIFFYVQQGKTHFTIATKKLSNCRGLEQRSMNLPKKKRESAETVKKVNELCKEFGFTVRVSQSVMAQERKEKCKNL